MGALTADKQGLETGIGNTMRHQIAAATKIFKRALVGFSAGYARNLVAGDNFGGLAIAQADNSDGAAGQKEVEVDYPMIRANLTGLAVTDIGKDVYATNSNVDDLTLTATDNTKVGYVKGFISAGVGWVQLVPATGVS